MGNELITQFSWRVIRVDNERSLLYVKGPIPGSIGGMVRVKDSIKKKDKQKFETNPVKVGVDTWDGPEIDPAEDYSHENAGAFGPDNDED